MLKITDVRALPGDSAFLIDDGKTAVMYDSGFAFTGFAVADKIKKVLGDRSLDYIFLSHSHYDHALGSAYAARYWPEVKVVAGAYAAKIFQKESARALMRDLDRKFAEKNGVTDYEDLIDELRVDLPVEDGDIINAGDMRFTAVALPGHTKCSFGFYLDGEKLLLGSETLGVYDGEGLIMPAFLVGYKMTLDSIEKLNKIDIENILLPHYGLLSREKTRFYLGSAAKSNIEATEEIVSNLRAGKTKEEAARIFKRKFYVGYLRDIYPEDAFNLNTGITINLIERELISENRN